MKTISLKRSVAVLVLSLGCLVSAGGYAQSVALLPDLQKAEQLMQAGKPGEAYSLLEPYEDQYAGDLRFDYLFGIAALDAGKADKATLAFERVLAVDPNYAGARLDMARAYYLLGDMTRARQEFTTVLEQNPPPAARLTIEKYIAAIEAREKAKTTLITGFAEATIGYDSNVNNSTASTLVNVPALGNLTFNLSPNNIQQGDMYGALVGGADIVHEVRPGIAVYGGATARFRANQSADTFDNKAAEARGGAVFSGEKTLLRVNANYEDFYLDNLRNRQTVGLGADARYALDRANFVNVLGQMQRFRFNDVALKVNDFDMALLGAGWLRLFADGKSAVNASLFYGKENQIYQRADGDKDFIGARVGGMAAYAEKVDLFGSFGYQHGKYDEQNVSFLTTREDRQFDAVVGLVYRLKDNWTVRPQLLWIENISNIEIYKYRRHDVSVTLRRDFR